MRLGFLWTLGALAGAVGTAVLFDSAPGINWGIWTIVAIAGLLAFRQPERDTLRALAIPLGFALVLAIGASVTAAPERLFAILVIVASLMALAVMIARDDSIAENYGAVDIVTAPFKGLAHSVRGAATAVIASAESADSLRERPVARGALIATPVVLVLALLFASADPFLARGRDVVVDAFSSWSGTPRIIFGVLLTLFVTGAYVASRAVVPSPLQPLKSAPPSRIGLTERRVVLIAAAASSWLFVLLQISYLFGALPSVAGSGITYAEYARRGFGELAIAATGVGLLIVAAHFRVAPAEESRARRVLTWPSLALLGAVCCILLSAFHRVNLYEAAYGYTTTRVYAQAYMIVTLVVLLMLAYHVVRIFDVRAIARGVMVVALSALVVIVFWNSDAWVARANVDRYATTGKLDLQYLAKGLSPDAYPALMQSLPRVAAPERAQLVAALGKSCARESGMKEPLSWYEWNMRRSRARQSGSCIAPPPTT